MPGKTRHCPHPDCSVPGDLLPKEALLRKASCLNPPFSRTACPAPLPPDLRCFPVSDCLYWKPGPACSSPLLPPGVFSTLPDSDSHVHLPEHSSLHFRRLDFHILHIASASAEG